MPLRFFPGRPGAFYPDPIPLPHRPGWPGWPAKLAWYFLAGSILWLAKGNRHRQDKRGPK